MQGGVIVGISVAIWWPAFTIGAWGTLFFDQLLTVWAASSAAFIVVLIQPRGQKRRVWRALALLVPSVWLVLAVASEPSETDVLSSVVDVLAVIVGLLGIPAALWVLARLIWPDFGVGVSWRRRLVVIGAIAAITVISFELGVHQSAFLTCEDFTISGNSEPPGCVHATP